MAIPRHPTSHPPPSWIPRACPQITIKKSSLKTLHPAVPSEWVQTSTLAYAIALGLKLGPRGRALEAGCYAHCIALCAPAQKWLCKPEKPSEQISAKVMFLPL